MEQLEMKKDCEEIKEEDKDAIHKDFLTKIIGLFGPFHFVVYTTLAMTISLHSWQMMANKFYTYKTDHFCARPLNLAHLDMENWLNLSHPMGEDKEYDRCKIFDIDYNSIESRPDENTQTIECNTWEYSNEYFDETITKRWDLVCGHMVNLPRIVQIVFFVGNMVGVLLIGPFSDWYGRKTGFLTAMTIWSVASIIGYMTDNPIAWIITRFVAGGASIAYVTAADVYKVELTSGYWRARVSHWFGELWWQFGHLSLGLLVYAIPNMKHLELFIGLSAVPFMALWWLLPESPRWLLSKGKNQEAVKVIKLVCKWNKMPIENVEQWNIQDTESSVSKGTFKDLMDLPGTRRNAIVMTFCWLAFSMGYFGLVYNTPAFDWNIYLVFIFPTFFTIPLSFLQPSMENIMGRKLVLTGSLMSAGVLLLLTIVVPEGIPVIVLAWIGTIATQISFGDGYTYTKELFPTMLRTTALGTASAGARVGSLSSPFIAMLDAFSPVIPLAVYGIIVLLAGIISLWLWPETNKQKLPETLEEAEKAAVTQNTWVKCCAKADEAD